MAEDTKEPQILSPRAKLISSISNAEDDFNNEMTDPKRGHPHWWQCFYTRTAQIKYAFLIAEKAGELSLQEIKVGHSNLESLEQELRGMLGIRQRKSDKELLEALKTGHGLEPKGESQRSVYIINGDYKVKMDVIPAPENTKEWFAKLDILNPSPDRNLSQAA